MKKWLAVLMALCLVIPVFAAAEGSDYFTVDNALALSYKYETYYRFLGFEKAEDYDPGSWLRYVIGGPSDSSALFYFIPEDTPSTRIYFAVQPGVLPWNSAGNSYTLDTLENINSDGNDYFANFRQVMINGRTVPCVDYYPQSMKKPYYMTNYYFPEEMPSGFFGEISVLHYYVDEAGEYQVYEGEELEARAEKFLSVMGMSSPEDYLSFYTDQVGDWETVREKAEAAGGRFENIKNTSLKIWIPDAMQMGEESSDTISGNTIQITMDTQKYQYTPEETADQIEAEDKRNTVAVALTLFHGFDCADFVRNASFTVFRELKVNGLDGTVACSFDYLGSPESFYYLFPLEDGFISLSFSGNMQSDYDGGTSKVPIRDPQYWYYAEWMASSIQPAD